jgi:Alkylmercury lyase
VSRDVDPVPALASSAGRMSRPARQVHQAVLAAFAATGTPPSPAEIEGVIRADGGDPQRVLAELTAADLLAFTDRGDIRAAYPFSPVPTVIRVSWDGGPDAYAMCAIDALGMSAMLGQPVTIAASEPDTGRAISVVVDGARARWLPRTAVVFAGATSAAGCPSVDRCCGHINFFTTARAARGWARRHPEITGEILRRDGALRIGIDQFGTLMQPAGSDASGQGR